MREIADVCVFADTCRHVRVLVCLFELRLYSKIRIQYKIDDNSLSEKNPISLKLG